MTELQKRILNECITCVEAWKVDNWHEPIDIDYDDYVNHCYNYGGSEVRNLIEELLSDSSDEEQQDFYDAVSFACENHNRGIRSAVGCRLRHFRQQRNLTQQQLADLAGVTKANICNIERGAYSVGLDVLNKIATALGAEIQLISNYQ